MSKNQLLVNERFVSVQGESTHAGRICWFIRLCGCNLNCNYCDTLYANDGELLDIDFLVDEATAAGVAVVEITGGEPLMQGDGCVELAVKLLAAGLEVLIETNGSCDISVLPAGVHRIMDCKLPASGMSENNLWSNYGCLTPLDEVKFVVSDLNDLLYALNVVEQYNLANTCEILYSPVWGKVSFEDLANWLITARAPGKMQLQMHKIIWGAEATGV